MEEVLDGLLLRAMAIDEVLAGATEDNLSSDGNLCILFEADGRLLLVAIVEDDGYASFGDTSLSALVNQVLNQVSQSLPALCNRSQLVAQTCRFCARTVLMFVMPRTKHIESSMLDFPLPLRPVMELKLSSQPLMTVRTA